MPSSGIRSEGDWDAASEADDLSDFSAVADDDCDVAALAVSEPVASFVDAALDASELVTSVVDAARAAFELVTSFVDVA